MFRKPKTDKMIKKEAEQRRNFEESINKQIESKREFKEMDLIDKPQRERTSDELVEALQPYGIVRVQQHERKNFTVVVTLFMHGMCSEVKIGFGENIKTMREALQLAYDKVMEVVTKPKGSNCDS